MSGLREGSRWTLLYHAIGTWLAGIPTLWFDLIKRAMPEVDFVVIGSGFGGAVVACRLAEAGQNVVVLERGREWSPKEYPSVSGKNWLFDVDNPQERNGWLDFRCFRNMAVAQGAGVGGGSLIYANVSVPPPQSTFERGWPEAITYSELGPYVVRVGNMLGVTKIPEGQRTKRWHIVQRGAEAIGQSDRFDSLPLAISFDPGYRPDQLADPTADSHAKNFTNRFDREQHTCIHLGHCDLGCRVQAKNTLDLNYLAQAVSKGAEIRPLHLARRLEREATHWRIRFDRLDSGVRTGSISTKCVVLAAGSLGSTELLLRSELTGMSPRLGRGWSANGDFLTPAVYREAVDPTRGPTITARIDHTDGSVYGEHIFIQDGGLPHLLDAFVGARLTHLPRDWRRRLGPLSERASKMRLAKCIMPWFAQGIDASDGRLYMRRRFWFFGDHRLDLKWNIRHSRATINAIVSLHRQLATATGGDPITSPTWTLLRDLITPHPLGGCNMADCPNDGVVDHAGRVFGEHGLYVMDGAVIPRAIGRNPSRTIAAVAERAVRNWLRE